MKLIKFVFLFSIFFLLSVKIVKAQVVINEFSSGTTSDWIELYNISTESADISTYKLTDSGTNEKTLTGTIPSGGFISFSFSNWLNNSTSDAVKLFKDNSLIDSIYYGGDGQVCFAGPDESIGRYPDGGNVIERFSVQTKDNPNNQSLNPCPTPTPSPTPTPTQSPSPTPTPTPTKTPTPIPTKPPTPKPTLILTSTPTENVLGTETETFTPVPTTEPTQSPQPVTEKSNLPIIAAIFIGSGIVLIGISIFVIIKTVKKGYTNMDEKEDSQIS